MIYKILVTMKQLMIIFETGFNTEIRLTFIKIMKVKKFLTMTPGSNLKHRYNIPFQG